MKSTLTNKLGNGRTHLLERQLGRRGAATLEMFFCLGFLLIVTFGSIDFGYALYTKNQLTGAAREGARAGIISGATNTDVTNAVANVMNVAGLKNSYTVTTTPTSISTATSGTAIQVLVKYNWGSGLGLSSWSKIGNGTTMTISASATMRKE